MLHSPRHQLVHCKRKRCLNCHLTKTKTVKGWDIFTYYKCELCNVPLCKSKDCFEMFHKRTDCRIHAEFSYKTWDFANKRRQMIFLTHIDSLNKLDGTVFYAAGFLIWKRTKWFINYFTKGISSEKYFSCISKLCDNSFWNFLSWFYILFHKNFILIF